MTALPAWMRRNHYQEEDPGTSWTKDPGVVIDVDADRAAHRVLTPHVIALPTGGYRMYYSSQVSERVVTEGGGQKIVSATSSDGLNWRLDGAAVVPDGKGPDAVKASEMCTFELPAAVAERKFGMVYEACDGTTPKARGVWRIARAFAQVAR